MALDAHYMSAFYLARGYQLGRGHLIDCEGFASEWSRYMRSYELGRVAGVPRDLVDVFHEYVYGVQHD